MANAEDLRAQRERTLEATSSGPPSRTSNPFFGVGPITDATVDEVDARLARFEFDAWLERNYRKLDDRGLDRGPFTWAELARSMHRGHPADKILLDMMRAIHRYFEFPKANKMAVGLGGGHSGFTVCASHLMTAEDPAQQVYVDTLRPESEGAEAGGFFRQSWGAQLIEMQRHSKNGDEARIHFAEKEGAIPPWNELQRLGVKLFIGVGHETTGATAYTATDIANLIDWLGRDPAEHHAVLDATSMLGAMPWGEEVVRAVVSNCCLFMPLQKAVGGISGYFVASFTPRALDLVERNQKNPSWAVPRQLKIVAPVDPTRPLTGEQTINVGPIYDPTQDKMLGGVINTYSALAFAETTFGLLRSERRIGTVSDLNARSIRNRETVNAWVARNSLFELGVPEPERRGAAVTLLKVADPDIVDMAIHTRIVARSKQLLGYEGITHPNGEHEPGLDVARYVNAFPGTPGNYRAWIGGIRSPEDIEALLDNLRYAYLRAKITIIEEELAHDGEAPPLTSTLGRGARRDDQQRAYKVLIADLVGMRFGPDGKPDYREVRDHIHWKGGVFHMGPLGDGDLEKGRIHFFYQPDLSTEAEILPQTARAQYDAIIAAATFIPKNSQFPLGGVRIGSGTGNMGSASWGGGNGIGGEAPLMNTPSFNSRATAQMAFKALLRVMPDLPVDELHRRVVAKDFDTGKDLRQFPTEKLEGRKIAVIGYGNIGREMAKVAKAFGMHVTIHARPRHRGWIESEGFEFASTLEEAAAGAHVISVHTGLGPFDAASRRFANEGLLESRVFGALSSGAVLINYDRGEIVDTCALEAALVSGRVRHACIDADLFRDAESGSVSGPMLPYRDLEARHPGKLELLPHAAADTDHPSRVEGAKQAIEQVFDVIHFGLVTNLKGDLPPGYVDGGSRTIKGVGAASPNDVARAVTDDAMVRQMREAAEALAAIWGAFSTTVDAARRAELIQRYGARLVLHSNRYAALTEKLGLRGPYA
jgi:lactate dehydrogenase-like 2-hydroxyacid dehydrogenase/phosphoserine aminotransferase